MNTFSIFTLKVLRKLFVKSVVRKDSVFTICEQNPDKASQIIYDTLQSDKPCMIARFGSTELKLIANYIGVKRISGESNAISFIKGQSLAWWWEKKKINQIQTNAGFFPNDISLIEAFCELMVEDVKEVDILGSWLIEEKYFENELINANSIFLLLLDPYWSKAPWTRALEGKKILVVHPFAKTIEQQYKKREFLFSNNLLPEFELNTIKAVQSIAGEKTEFADWFQALESMKSEIDKVDYDICLIGCGAYGFPLAAHVKRMGKKGFHIGGSLQLLFGIRGKRWEDENYNNTYNYAKLVNEYWVKPSEDETPTFANTVEGACYW